MIEVFKFEDENEEQCRLKCLDELDVYNNEILTKEYEEDNKYKINYDRYYRFEGYQIFQLLDETVSVADLYDQSKSRLIAQCDIENYDPSQNNQPIAKLINYSTTDDIISGQVMVDGENKGIRHSFKITEDKFASTNDKRIVNNKKYYYI